MKKSEDIKIYLSYSFKDQLIADRIIDYMRRYGIEILPLEPLVTNSASILKNTIHKVITSGDYFIPLISSNYFNSGWTKFELDTALTDEFNTRAIIIVPVIIEKLSLPRELMKYQAINFGDNFDSGMELLLNYLKPVKYLDFAKLNPFQFEKLIFDLLSELGFNCALTKDGDMGVDIQATYHVLDPFGVANVTENWWVQVKFYKDSRASVKEIDRLSGYLENNPGEFKFLLVTNGNLTSLAKERIEKLNKKTKVYFRAIEGTELRRLLLKYPSLVNRYFLKSLEVQDE